MLVAERLFLCRYGIDSVGSITGYTYVIESTTETYTLGFGGEGNKFSTLKSK